MVSNRIEELLDEVLTLFQQPGDEVETGLDTDDGELLQLRKACRLLEAATFLEAENGYYTVVIEGSFAAIERTIQFYLLHTDLLHEDEYVTHETVYERGFEAGLYDEAFEEKLVGLWRDNRSKRVLTIARTFETVSNHEYTKRETLYRRRRNQDIL